MPLASRFLNHSPRWHRTLFRVRPRTEREMIIASWIKESGSLTERLIQSVGQGFRVVVLQQRLGSGYAEERQALGLTRDQQAIIREVALQSNDQPLVLARSIIPQSTLIGADRRLGHLGNQPLGHILFKDPRLTRETLEVCYLRPQSIRADAPGIDPQHPEPLWGRRSLYQLGEGHPLLVAEFFLPSLLDQNRSSS
ncbi:MAG: chorismate lyase [Gammaproteobacteria bacterium]|nr:chorismate lyase [Gammaproteobacteria bacterium]NBT45930.1 chorismate lyase [Gammaproteobacteria bacterium]NBY23460.1 chorismate lyase [Gammaproteobacteria bacterium]